MFIDFREEGEEREREKQTLIGCLPYAPQLGIEPVTEVCPQARETKLKIHKWNYIKLKRL